MITKLIEMCFEKQAESPNVFGNTYEECTEHE